MGVICPLMLSKWSKYIWVDAVAAHTTHLQQTERLKIINVCVLLANYFRNASGIGRSVGWLVSPLLWFRLENLRSR